MKILTELVMKRHFDDGAHPKSAENDTGILSAHNHSTLPQPIFDNFSHALSLYAKGTARSFHSKIKLRCVEGTTMILVQIPGRSPNRRERVVGILNSGAPIIVQETEAIWAQRNRKARHKG